MEVQGVRVISSGFSVEGSFDGLGFKAWGLEFMV